MPEKAMTIYGLTGKTGAGKSTVAKKLRDKGFFIIDGDEVARRVVSPGSDVLVKLSEAFGNDIILKSGELDRKKLAAKAFCTKENTELLNSITHSAIDKVFRNLIGKAKIQNKKYVVIDAAALLESPSKNLCDKIIVVTAPTEIRLERILGRDKISSEQAMTRINAQKSDEYYLSKADIIIRNYPPYNIDDEIGDQINF